MGVAVYAILAMLAVALSVVPATTVYAAQLKVTNEHPFFVDDRWVLASDLKVGDSLMTEDGRVARITGITDVQYPNGIEVFNLHVNGTENYFAGGVLVHNKPDIEWPEAQPGKTQYETFAEWWTNAEKDDPALCELFKFWKSNYKPSGFSAKALAEAMEKRIVLKEIAEIKTKLKAGAVNTPLTCPGSKRGAILDNIERFVNEHGPGGPNYKQTHAGEKVGWVQNDRFEDPHQVLAEAMQRWFWKEKPTQVTVKATTIDGRIKTVIWRTAPLQYGPYKTRIFVGHLTADPPNPILDALPPGVTP